jgi:uncharacterized protein YecT (DUF1311 family)
MCAISNDLSVLAANEEPVPVQSPSKESLSVTGQAEQKPEVLYTSPSGAFRIEFSPIGGPGTEGATEDLWVVSTKEASQRAKLPKQSADSPSDDEFHFSPNEEWLFGLRHVGSGLRYGNVYHVMTPLKIEKPVTGEFNDVVWENSVKLGALKEDYSAAGVYAMTFFEAWSFDSSRLLIKLCGGEEKRSMRCGLLYFNTRNNKFELTNYLRKLNKTKSEFLACAEPVDPLPSEAELKTKLQELDQRLNKRYAEVLAKMDQDQAANVREAQRKWIKHRDDGAKFYVSLFPMTEKERRRLQFLCEVTAARIYTQPDEAWEL